MERKFKISDCVFAKLGCYPFWPARVLELVDGSEELYKVIFYGTHDWETICAKDLVKYNEQSLQMYGSRNKYRGFQKALQEIQLNLSFNNFVLVNDRELQNNKRKRINATSGGKKKGRKFKRVKLSN